MCPCRRLLIYALVWVWRIAPKLSLVMLAPLKTLPPPGTTEPRESTSTLKKEVPMMQSGLQPLNNMMDTQLNDTMSTRIAVLNSKFDVKFVAIDHAIEKLDGEAQSYCGEI